MAIATLLLDGTKALTHIPAEGTSYFQQLKEKQNLISLVKIWSVFSLLFFSGLYSIRLAHFWQIHTREMERVLPEWVPCLAVANYP